MRGKLITIEGVDGAGKTTLAAALTTALTERGLEVEALREPGGVEIAERIRTIVKDPSIELSPRAEALLYAAARAELVDSKIEPALAAGRWVLLDRFVDSSLAYQGGARNLGVETIRSLNEFATGGLVPDRTLLLELVLKDARQRARGRYQSTGEADRFELQNDAFFERITAVYRGLAAAEPERFRVLDGGLEPEALCAAALAALADLL